MVAGETVPCTAQDKQKDSKSRKERWNERVSTMYKLELQWASCPE